MQVSAVDRKANVSAGGEMWLSFIPSPVPFITSPNCVFSLCNSIMVFLFYLNLFKLNVISS